MGCSPWGREELDMTEQLSSSSAHDLTDKSVVFRTLSTTSLPTPYCVTSTSASEARVSARLGAFGEG